MSPSAGWLMIIFLFAGSAEQQKNDHIKWHFTSIEQSGSDWTLSFTATIDRGWHLYSQSSEPDGPMPTEFSFESSDKYRLVGKTIEEGDVKKSYDSTFMVNVRWYETKVVFTQRVKAVSKADVKGKITYSVCSEEVCVPGSVVFSLDVGR